MIVLEFVLPDALLNHMNPKIYFRPGVAISASVICLGPCLVHEPWRAGRGADVVRRLHFLWSSLSRSLRQAVIGAKLKAQHWRWQPED